MQFNFYIVFLCNGIYNIALLSAVTEKRVSAAEAHEIEYVPMHTIREITRLATMLEGLIAPWLRLGFVSASSWLCLSYVTATHRLYLDYVSPTPRLHLGFDLLRALSLVTQQPSLCAQARNILLCDLQQFDLLRFTVLHSIVKVCRLSFIPRQF